MIRAAWRARRALQLIRLSGRFLVMNAIDSLTWDCQTCRRCGRVQRAEYHADDWTSVVGHAGSVLCIDCYAAVRDPKGVLMIRIEQ